MEILLNLLTYSLPGGFLGSVFAWLVGRRRQDNDMLVQLQKSINMLSEENRKILDENIKLRKEKRQLNCQSEAIKQNQKLLEEEIKRLRAEIIKLTSNNQK